VYTPSAFNESRLPVLHALIRAQPFATLVGHTRQGLDAVHVPMVLDDTRGPHGVLQGHVARANPLWRALGGGAEVLAVFHGPHHYVSPNWYPAKLEHGKVVPTWNYVVVHARGPIEWIHEPDWLRGLLGQLTRAHEQGRPDPWSIDDAPADYVERLLRGIVGFEIPVTAMTGAWKLSQNWNATNRAGVIAGLGAEADGAAAEVIAHMMASGTGGPADQ
jgi:transcriptional regulator